jgi:hypothetical protein
MLRAVLTLLLAGLLAPAVLAQEKFTIKIKKDAKGSVNQVTETESEQGKTSITIMGKAQPKDEESTSSAAFKEEILEKEPGKRPTKSKRTYQKAEGAKNGKALELSLVGKEILITREGKKAEYTVDGKELTGDNITFLKMQAHNKSGSDDESAIEDQIVPKQPVAVNETWKVDMDAIIKDFTNAAPFTVDQAKSSGTGKLLKAYKKDGKQFGIVDVEMTLVVTKIGAGAMAIELNANSQAKVTLHFDGCIDGSSSSGAMEMKMQLKMGGAIKTPDGMEIKLDVDATNKGTRTQEDLTGKK